MRISPVDSEVFKVVTKILGISQTELALLQELVERGGEQDLSYLISLLDDAEAALKAAYEEI